MLKLRYWYTKHWEPVRRLFSRFRTFHLNIQLRFWCSNSFSYWYKNITTSYTLLVFWRPRTYMLIKLPIARTQLVVWVGQFYTGYFHIWLLHTQSLTQGNLQTRTFSHTDSSTLGHFHTRTLPHVSPPHTLRFSIMSQIRPFSIT